MFNNTAGFFYHDFGPGDQGILNKFYEYDIRNQILSSSFNAKPYYAFNNNSFIVHFHGPKPFDYYTFVTTGFCRFNTMCQTAFNAGLCQYIQEWSIFSDDTSKYNLLVLACFGRAPVKMPGFTSLLVNANS